MVSGQMLRRGGKFGGGLARAFRGGAELAKMAPDGSYNVQRIQIKIAALQIATIYPL